MSVLAQAMIVNAAVLVSVLATDLGPARKIGTARILRPLIVAAVIVPLFVKSPAGHGMNLVLELSGVVIGVLAGLAAVALMGVYRSPSTGKPVSRAGIGYALLWTLIIAARAAFSYGTAHWWTNQIVHWAIVHQVTVEAITDGLVFMAITMLVTRTIGLWIRASHLPATQSPAVPAVG